MVEDAQRHLVHTIFYGRLDRILECQLNSDPIWGKLGNTFFLLAVITPCSTGGQDGAQCHVTYSGTTAQIVTDLRVVQCVIGRVKSGGRWGIIDRSGILARTQFMDQDGDDDDDDD
jgi:hypothetical protein